MSVGDLKGLRKGCSLYGPAALKRCCHVLRGTENSEAESALWPDGPDSCATTAVPRCFGCTVQHAQHRVAVRRYIKGNLSAALVCSDDGANEPADARDKRYARALRRQHMIPGTGPGGFKVDFGP